MNKIILIPDSFKGTMSSIEVCELLQSSIAKLTDAKVISVPVADGGEGSVDAFLAASPGKKIYVNAQNPYGEDMESFYGVIDGGRTAVIEMAACAGLPLVEARKNPAQTSTYGVGQLMKHALYNGCENIILGLGGSCTNDGGAGCAAALGVKFYSAGGKEFIPVGGTLKDIAKIDTTFLEKSVKAAKITVMCDIDNPLYGKNGAAFVFAPQKGASADMVKELDSGLVHFADTINTCLGVDVCSMPGGGAAGGMGAGMHALLGAKLQMGIDTVLDSVGFDDLLEGADLVISGEGRIDGQTAGGKVVAGVAKRASRKNVPIIAIVGDVADGSEKLYDMGLTAIFSINRLAVDFSKAKTRAKQDLSEVAQDIFRLLTAFNI